MIHVVAEWKAWAFRACLVSVTLAFGLACPAHAQKCREGYLLHEGKPSKTFYYYHIVEDSLIQIREASRASTPIVSLPASIVRTLNRELDQATLTGSGTTVPARRPSKVEGAVQRYDREATLLTRLVSLFMLVLVGLGVVLWRRRAGRRRLAKKRAQARHHLVEEWEDERRRLAQDLHDGPVQDLHALRMRLSMRSVPHEVLKEELLHVIRELRAISEDLRPPSLTHFGLAAALNAHIERFKKRHPHVRLHSYLEPDERHLPERIRIALFRICQEALNNAVQHAEPSSLSIRLGIERETLTLEVRDDGSGFTVPDDWLTLAKHGHYGLLGMSERAESLGATLEVTSAPGQGTCIRVKLPLPLEEASTADQEVLAVR